MKAVKFCEFLIKRAGHLWSFEVVIKGNHIIGWGRVGKWVEPWNMVLSRANDIERNPERHPRNSEGSMIRGLGSWVVGSNFAYVICKNASRPPESNEILLFYTVHAKLGLYLLTHPLSDLWPLVISSKFEEKAVNLKSCLGEAEMKILWCQTQSFPKLIDVILLLHWMNTDCTDAENILASNGELAIDYLCLGFWFFMPGVFNGEIWKVTFFGSHSSRMEGKKKTVKKKKK